MVLTVDTGARGAVSSPASRKERRRLAAARAGRPKRMGKREQKQLRELGVLLTSTEVRADSPRSPSLQKAIESLRGRNTRYCAFYLRNAPPTKDEQLLTELARLVSQDAFSFSMFLLAHVPQYGKSMSEVALGLQAYSAHFVAACYANYRRDPYVYEAMLIVMQQFRDEWAADLKMDAHACVVWPSAIGRVLDGYRLMSREEWLIMKPFDIGNIPEMITGLMQSADKSLTDLDKCVVLSNVVQQWVQYGMSSEELMKHVQLWQPLGASLAEYILLHDPNMDCFWGSVRCTLDEEAADPNALESLVGHVVRLSPDTWTTLLRKIYQFMRVRYVDNFEDATSSLNDMLDGLLTSRDRRLLQLDDVTRFA